MSIAVLLGQLLSIIIIAERLSAKHIITAASSGTCVYVRALPTHMRLYNLRMQRTCTIRAT